MAKKYDIVNTSKMSATYDASLIDVTHRADTALENGRLIALKSNGKMGYAEAGDANVYLHASVEKMYDTVLGLTEFRAEADELVRGMGMRKFDEFSTTAFDGVAVAGDKVVLGSNGILAKSATPAGTENFIGEVVSRTTLGYDKTVAIAVRVLKA